MGIFDKWSKKTEQEQLASLKNKKSGVKVASKKSVGKTSEEKNEVVSTEKVVTSKKNITKVGNAYKILKRPIVSEKAAVLESVGVYTFEVALGATKVDVKNAIKQVYDINPVKINIVNVEGKDARFGRNYGKRKDWKKAVVTLPKGKTISIHEGV